MTFERTAQIHKAHFSKLLELNNAHHEMLSWLEMKELQSMVADSFHARQIGTSEGLLITFDQDAAYDSTNFRWFQARYPRFVYVDRIVIDPKARGKRYGLLLYGELFEIARAAGHKVISCEVNMDPPNPVSHKFSRAMGFEKVGEAIVDPAKGKKVAYYIKKLGKRG